MARIDELLAQAETERHRAISATTAVAREHHVMHAERLLDEAWRLNELDPELAPLISGLWSSQDQMARKTA